MSLLPTLEEQISRARSDLRMGLPVIIGDWLTAAVETLHPARLASACALGQPVLVITARRAETLKARAYDGDLARIHVPTSADITWLRAVMDPSTDMATPLKGPFATLRDGNTIPHLAAITLTKSAQLLPAVLMVQTDTALSALTRLSPVPLMEALATESLLHPVAAARLPLEASEQTRLHILRPEDGATEHYAVEIGTPSRTKAALVRLHSACFTGDVLGSLKCDCGPQLHTALQRMGEAGEGVLLYLNQEGRGIGLANKMRAYTLQDQGFDTVEANHRLGFEDDERDFRIGAGILREMGFSRVRLMTNNPRKVEMLATHGIEVVERVPLILPPNRFNRAYLATKARKSGHLL
ncbi:MAG: GTP cyclohydrolase II [Paracoccus sp. (in: a-proteobacteria)]